MKPNSATHPLAILALVFALLIGLPLPTTSAFAQEAAPDTAATSDASAENSTPTEAEVEATSTEAISQAAEEEEGPIVTQGEMNRQAAESLAKADKELNAFYGQLMKALDPKDVPKVRQAQRDWIKYRDSYAKAVADFVAEGGSMWPLIYHGTRDRLTRQQIKNLRDDFGRFVETGNP